MAGVSRINIDMAGGLIVGNLAPNVYVNGAAIVVQGAAIVGHGSGAHAGPALLGCSGKVFAHGIGVCRAGDAATCGHTASGSGNVIAG